MALIMAHPVDYEVNRVEGQRRQGPLGFDAISAPIDILIPPLFRRTNAAVRGENEVACVMYADPTVPATECEPLQAGESSVEWKPAVRPHKDSKASGLGTVGGPGGYQFTYRPDEQQSVKQGLLEVLLGATDGATGDYGSGRPLPAPTIEEEVGIRLQGEHCDATYITSPTLLLRLVGLVLRNRTDPARVMVGCVASLDLSHTTLGTVGPAGPPLRFEGLSSEVSPPWRAADMRFYPDQPQPWSTCPDKVRIRLAARSLALCYVAPLLFVPGAQNYAVRQLICAHCQLTDADAEAFASILGHKSSDHHRCLLESVDLSFNYITDSGAVALLRALKQNRTVTRLSLAGNPAVTKRTTLADIEKRLETVRRQKSKKRSWFAKLFAR